MREITDTTNKYTNKDIPDGTWIFKVLGIEKKYGKIEFFVWKLAHDGGEGEQVLLPNMMGGLLRALKCQESEPNKFDWDTEEQIGKYFWATVTHAPDKKDATKIRQHMGDFKVYEDTEIPF